MGMVQLQIKQNKGNKKGQTCKTRRQRERERERDIIYAA